MTDGWKFELKLAKKKLLEVKGKENLSTNIGGGQRLSIVDKGKEAHNTQQQIATELGWSTGKVASGTPSMFGELGMATTIAGVMTPDYD